MTTPVAARISLAAIAGAVITLSSAQAGGCGGAECYRHVNTPPVYGAVSERVLVRPAETVYRTVPPVYDTVSERVLVAPGGFYGAAGARHVRVALTATDERVATAADRLRALA